MNVEIAQRLAARRKQAGLSQEALAERLGVSRQAVSKWERSESSPDTDNLIALAQLYGLSLDDLLYVDDEIRDDVTFEAACRAAERLDAAKAGSGAPQVPCTSGTLGNGAAGATAAAVGAGTPGVAGAVCGAGVGASAPDSASAGAACAGDAADGNAAADSAFSAKGAADAEAAQSKVKIGLGGIHVLDGDDYVHVSWRDGVHVHDGKKGDEVHVGWDGVHVKEGRAATGDARSERNAERDARHAERDARRAAGRQGDWFSASDDGFAAADDEGNEVHVDSSGVVINGEHFDSWQDAHARYGYGHLHEERWNEPCGYTVCGERFDTLEQARAKYGDGVGTTIPVRKHYLRAFEKSWAKFPYPLVVILAYLLLGIFDGAWGMGLFLFFTIPLYYMLGHAIGRKRLAPFLSGAYPICVVAWFCFMAFVLNQPHPAWVAFLTIPLAEWLVWSLSHWWRGRKRHQASVESAPIEVEVEVEKR